MDQIQTSMSEVITPASDGKNCLVEFCDKQKFQPDLIQLLKAMRDQGFSCEFEHGADKLLMARFVRKHEAVQVIVVPTSPVTMNDCELMASKDVYLRFSYNGGTGTFYELFYYWNDMGWVRGGDIHIRTSMHKWYSPFGEHQSQFLCLVPHDTEGEFVFPEVLTVSELVSMLSESRLFLTTPDKEL